MQTQAKLCHFDQARCVVLVEGFEGDRSLGSALAEGSTVMEAEDLAISRLQHRCAGATSDAEDLAKRAKLSTESKGNQGHPAIRKPPVVRQPSTPKEDAQQNVLATTPGMPTRDMTQRRCASTQPNDQKNSCGGHHKPLATQ